MWGCGFCPGDVSAVMSMSRQIVLHNPKWLIKTPKQGHAHSLFFPISLSGKEHVSIKMINMNVPLGVVFKLRNFCPLCTLTILFKPFQACPSPGVEHYKHSTPLSMMLTASDTAEPFLN